MLRSSGNPDLVIKGIALPGYASWREIKAIDGNSRGSRIVKEKRTDKYRRDHYNFFESIEHSGFEEMALLAALACPATVSSHTIRLDRLQE